MIILGKNFSPFFGRLEKRNSRNSLIELHWIDPSLMEHRGAEMVGDSKIRVAPPQAETSV